MCLWVVPILYHLPRTKRDPTHSIIPVTTLPKAWVCGRLLGWDCAFESRRWYGCRSLVGFMCFQVEVSATGRSLVQRSPTECVCVCVRASKRYHETLKMNEEAWAHEDGRAIQKVISSYFPLTEISSFCHHQPRVGVYAFYPRKELNRSSF